MATAQPIDECLASAGGLTRVLEHARLLLRADAIYQRLAPAALARASRVANLKSGILVIHADNGAVAAKLHQFTGRLANEFFKQGLECNGIQVTVQPAIPEIVKQKLPHTPRKLPPVARNDLQALAESLPASDGLRAALERLLRTEAAERPVARG